MAKQKKEPREEYYVCDVCLLRFKPQPDPAHPELDDSCPRCHTPFIHPASVSPQTRRYGGVQGNMESHYVSCG